MRFWNLNIRSVRFGIENKRQVSYSMRAAQWVGLHLVRVLSVFDSVLEVASIPWFVVVSALITPGMWDLCMCMWDILTPKIFLSGVFWLHQCHLFSLDQQYTT